MHFLFIEFGTKLKDFIAFSYRYRQKVVYLQQELA